MTTDKLNPANIPAPVGAYTHGVLAPAGGRWLHVSGQIGMRPDDSLADGFASQAEAAWEHLLGVLRAAGMDASHLVKVTTHLVDGEHLKELNAVRSRFLGGERLLPRWLWSSSWRGQSGCSRWRQSPLLCEILAGHV